MELALGIVCGIILFLFVVSILAITISAASAVASIALTVVIGNIRTIRKKA